MNIRDWIPVNILKALTKHVIAVILILIAYTIIKKVALYLIGTPEIVNFIASLDVILVKIMLIIFATILIYDIADGWIKEKGSDEDRFYSMV